MFLKSREILRKRKQMDTKNCQGVGRGVIKGDECLRRLDTDIKQRRGDGEGVSSAAEVENGETIASGSPRNPFMQQGF